jgi:hypothetical protein
MFIAKKPCRFSGIDYFVGDIIPDDVVSPEAAVKLIKQNRIVSIEEPKKEIIKVTPDTPPADKDTDGITPPADAEQNNITPPQTPLNDNSGTETPGDKQTLNENTAAPGETNKTTIDGAPAQPEKLTKNKLEKMLKPDVMAYAQSIGLPVDDTMTKDGIIKAVMLAGE